MASIVTITPNPTLDVSFEVDRIRPVHKMRGGNEQHDPGGGGINVARVFRRLGGETRCYYLAGGATGQALDWLLERHGLTRTKVPIAGETRVSTSVLERETGNEYRFVTDGPVIAAEEWQALEDALEQAECDYLVASGSLPRGVPADGYARIGALARRKGMRFVLDSSGAGLAGGLAGGGVFLVKPSIGELRALTGEALLTDEAVAEAAGRIVARGEVEHIAVTMGRDGAMLVNAAGALRLPAIPVKTASTVGAGDSFVAGMVHAFSQGGTPEEAFRFGMAAGGAAALSPGTNLASAEDIRRLHAQQEGARDL